MQKLTVLAALFLLLGAGCAPKTYPSEAYQCKEDTDCRIVSVDYCTEVCPRCDPKDALSDDMEAVNDVWCDASHEAARAEAQAGGDGTTCAACISPYENMDKVEAKCVLNECTKRVK